MFSGEFPQGCTVFKTISPNVEREESGMRDDTGMQLEFAYSEVYVKFFCPLCTSCHVLIFAWLFSSYVGCATGVTNST